MALTNAQMQINLTAAEAVVTGTNTDTHQGNYYSAFPPITPGTGVNKAQKVANLSVVTSTTPTDLDLTALAGGINAAAINFSLIKQVIVVNADVALAVTMGAGTNPATNVTGGTIVLAAGEVFARSAPFAGLVVDGTHKTLRLTAASGTPTVNLFIVGEGV